MNALKIGIIGCGKQAPKHIGGLRNIKGVDLVLADINPSCAEKLSNQVGIPWVPEVEEIFCDPKIQAIDICTPIPSHAELIRRAIDSSKDFFCEKPLCESLGETYVLADLAEKTGRIGMVGYIYRFAPVFELGHSLFEAVAHGGVSPALGRVVSAYFRLGGRGSHQVWKHCKKSGGGAINEMLVHMLDLAIWYFGSVRHVEILACDLLRHRRIIHGEEMLADAEDYILIRATTESGVKVLCQADLVTPAFTQLAEVQGENGTFVASIQAEMPSFLFCNHEAAGYKAGKTHFNFGPIDLFEAQMAEFVRSVRTKTLPDRCTIWDSILVMEALGKVRKGVQ